MGEKVLSEVKSEECHTVNEAIAWIRRADLGDKVVYFRGDLALARSYSPRLALLAQFVAAAAEAGVVVMYQRKLADSWYEYYMKKKLSLTYRFDPERMRARLGVTKSMNLPVW